MIISRIKKRITEEYYLSKFRLLNRNKNFTIISSNCVGSGIYQDLNIKYNTPTVGLYFYAPCYIKFIYNLRYYLEQPLLFQEQSKYTHSKATYPIGKLGDIEIHFLHYNEKDALESWNKRIERINYSNLYYIFTDRDMCTDKELKEFDEFESDKKICFSSRYYPDLKSVVQVKEYADQDAVQDLYSDKFYRKYLGKIKWFNYNN